MAQNISKIKKRINAISSTKKITNSMKLVSSVKTKKYTRLFSYNNEFNNRLEEMMINAFFNEEFIEKKDPTFYRYFKENEDVASTLYIIINSNMGLCGNYNTSINKYFSNIYKKGDQIILVGKKGLFYYKNENVNIDFLDINENLNNYVKLESFASFLLDNFLNSKCKKVEIIYSKYINSLLTKPAKKTLLPLSINTKDIKEKRYYEPIFEGGKKEFIEGFILSYITNMLKNIIIESSLSEETCRRNSMDNANKNIDDLLSDLSVQYNKARQNSITTEINDIVGGAKKIKNS